MSSTTEHKIFATLPIGDRDLGAEVELEIKYTFLPGAPASGPTYSSGGQPADPDEVEFVSCKQLINGVPFVRGGVFADLEQGALDTIAEAYLENEFGFEAAVEQACEDLEQRDSS